MADTSYKDDRSGPSGTKVETFLGADGVFQGVLRIKNTLCVEGRFKGKIEGESSVIIGRSGHIEADIVADHVIVNGDVSGSVSAHSQVDIGASGKVRGDVQSGVVTMEKGGFLQGYCRMQFNSDSARSPLLTHRTMSEDPAIQDPEDSSAEPVVSYEVD